MVKMVALAMLLLMVWFAKHSTISNLHAYGTCIVFTLFVSFLSHFLISLKIKKRKKVMLKCDQMTYLSSRALT